MHDKNHKENTSQNVIRSIRMSTNTEIIRKNNAIIAQSKARFQTHQSTEDIMLILATIWTTFLFMRMRTEWKKLSQISVEKKSQVNILNGTQVAKKEFNK